MGDRLLYSFYEQPPHEHRSGSAGTSSSQDLESLRAPPAPDGLCLDKEFGPTRMGRLARPLTVHRRKSQRFAFVQLLLHLMGHHTRTNTSVRTATTLGKLSSTDVIAD